ncbi:MAG: hypothetical protein ACRDP9_00970 [Kribbellaceae bacterium]
MDGSDGISFLGARCPKGFRLRTLTLLSRGAVNYRPAEWAGALVIVERGELEVECRGGARARFGEGAILAFSGLAVRRLRNPGNGPLVLSGLSRLRPAD